MALTIKAEDLRKLLAEIDNDADIVIYDGDNLRPIADVKLETIRRLDKSGSMSRVLPTNTLIFDLENNGFDEYPGRQHPDPNRKMHIAHGAPIEP